MTKTWFKRGVLYTLAVLLLVGSGLAGVRYWQYASVHVHTDNAYVTADVSEINARVPGRVSKVTVKDNWQVAAGHLLVQLDPADFEVAVAETEAALRQAKEQIDQQYAAVESAQAQVTVAEADLRQRQQDFQRAQALFAEEILPQERFEQTETALRMTEARLRAALTQREHARAALGGNLQGPRYERSAVKRAEAALEAARLNLRYTRITAPMSGFVSQKRVEQGQWVQPGQRLMTIVPLEQVWVEANYKETQLTHVRIGQPAEITADIYPGYTYRGRVESISSGTGAAFSLLPPENATGNWVKVVQRVPVKIVLDEPPPPERPLRLGLSVAVVIDTSHRSGPALLPPLAGRTYDWRVLFSQRASPSPVGLQAAERTE
jgi:membrane fusion protein (multidrug efflux system)